MGSRVNPPIEIPSTLIVPMGMYPHWLRDIYRNPDINVNTAII